MAEELPGPVLVTEGLTKIYGHRHIALNGVNLEVGPGSVLGILGPNGAGKSTLVRLLLGLQTPTTGRVYVFGKRMAPNAGLLRQRIGYLSGDLRLPQSRSAIDYLDLVGKLCGMSRSQRRGRLAFLVNAMDLTAEASQPIRSLSTGMRTRLGIAASLIHDPDLLIWDEPSRGLDPESRQTWLDMTERLAETKTIVLCSHNVADVAQLATHALLLDRGQVVYNGPPEDLAGPAPSHVEIDIKGDKKSIAEAFKSIQAFDELAAAKLNKNVLTFDIAQSASHATAVANVLVTLADHHLEMSDLRVSAGAGAGAMTTLIREEKSRGLSRVCATTKS